MLLLPYPMGRAAPDMSSFSCVGSAKNAIARASSASTTRAGTPWLVALKKPTLRHALATAAASPGADRSTYGMAAAPAYWVYCSTLD